MGIIGITAWAPVEAVPMGRGILMAAVDTTTMAAVIRTVTLVAALVTATATAIGIPVVTEVTGGTDTKIQQRRMPLQPRPIPAPRLSHPMRASHKTVSPALLPNVPQHMSVSDVY